MLAQRRQAHREERRERLARDRGMGPENSLSLKSLHGGQVESREGEARVRKREASTHARVHTHTHTQTHTHTHTHTCQGRWTHSVPCAPCHVHDESARASHQEGLRGLHAVCMHGGPCDRSLQALEWCIGRCDSTGACVAWHLVAVSWIPLARAAPGNLTNLRWLQKLGKWFDASESYFLSHHSRCCS